MVMVVQGCIATSPGNMVLNIAASNAQPHRTAKPSASAIRAQVRKTGAAEQAASAALFSLGLLSALSVGRERLPEGACPATAEPPMRRQPMTIRSVVQKDGGSTCHFAWSVRNSGETRNWASTSSSSARSSGRSFRTAIGAPGLRQRLAHDLYPTAEACTLAHLPNQALVGNQGIDLTAQQCNDRVPAA